MENGGDVSASLLLGRASGRCAAGLFCPEGPKLVRQLGCTQHRSAAVPVGGQQGTVILPGKALVNQQHNALIIWYG